MNKIIIILIILIAGIAWLKFTDNLDKKRDAIYENCEPMVDIDGNHKMVCK